MTEQPEPSGQADSDETHSTNPDAEKTEAGKPKTKPTFVTVASVDEIEPGESQAFEIGERVIAVFNDNGNFFAIDDMCPHMGASLATGFTEDCIVSCPWHGWRFDVRDGAWCDNRSLKIDAFDIRIVDQKIQVATEPRPKSETDVERA